MHKLHSLQKRGSLLIMEPIQDNMDKVQERHTKVQQYVEEINPKTVVAIEREEERLNQRYFHLMNQLGKLKYQILKLEEKKKSQEDLENHPSVKEAADELHKMMKYEKALTENHSKMMNEISQNKMTIAELKNTVYQKRIEIRDVVRDCLSTIQEIDHYQQKTVSMDRQGTDMFLTMPEQVINIPKPLILPQLPLKQKSKSVLLNIIKNVKSENQLKQVDEIMTIYKQVQELKQQTDRSQQLIQKMTNRYCQIKNLVSECASISLQVFKNKQKITNKNGYANSIYFDMNSTLSNSKNESTIIKDRKIQNILYDTLQQIMIDIIDSQQRSDPNGSSIADSIIRNSVSLEQFMQFTSVQILALLAMQPRLMTELLGLFELKQKQIGLLCNKSRQLSIKQQ